MNFDFSKAHITDWGTKSGFENSFFSVIFLANDLIEGKNVFCAHNILSFAFKDT